MVGNNKNWKLPENSSTGDIAFKDGDDENGKISSRLQKSKLTLIINANVWQHFLSDKRGSHRKFFLNTSKLLHPLLMTLTSTALQKQCKNNAKTMREKENSLFPLMFTPVAYVFEQTNSSERLQLWFEPPYKIDLTTTTLWSHSKCFLQA